MTTTIKLPSMLSFERKLEASDGLMFAGNWDDKKKEYLDDERMIKAWSEIKIIKRQNRSTQSAYGIDDNKKIMPNPVSSDSDDANLPIDKDTLKVSFTLRFIGNLGKPFACNKPEFADAIEQKVAEFKISDGLDDLAFRYAYNIANGRFLWRNRVCAEQVMIFVGIGEDKDLEFNAYDFSLKGFDTKKDDKSLGKLSEYIKQGLIGDENTYKMITVYAFVKLGSGQHVFPSQEMNMGEKKKKLFQLNSCAAMHNVKIGNAIRTVDTWYGDTMLIKAAGKGKTETVNIDLDFKYPIAIEPYGSVTQHGRAYRPTNNDLYSLMLNWLNGKDSINQDDQKYIVANLIRGGVFGGDSEG